MESNIVNQEDFKYIELRIIRDGLLADSDKYVLPDFPHISDEKKTEWITYRKALRDLPSTITTINIDESTGELSGFTWPTPPS